MPGHEGMNAEIGAQDSDAPPAGPLDDIRSGVKAFFDIGVKLGNSVDEHTDTMKRYLSRLQRNTPQPVRKVAQGTFTTGNLLLLALGKPDQGTNWQVRSIIVGGADVFTTAAGSAGIYVSALEPSPSLGLAAAGGMINAVDITTAMPNVSSWGSGQLIVLEHEHVFVIIGGSASNGQLYVANLRADAYPTDVAGGRAIDTI